MKIDGSLNQHLLPSQVFFGLFTFSGNAFENVIKNIGCLTHFRIINVNESADGVVDGGSQPVVKIVHFSEYRGINKCHPIRQGS